MAKQITTYSQLFNYQMKIARIALQKTADEVIENVIKKYIMDNWYNEHTPESYTRTYDYINSLVSSKATQSGNTAEVKIYFDTDRIIPNLIDGEWNQHMDIHGVPFNDLIPLFIEEGVNSPIYSYEGIHVMENSKKILEQTKYHLHEMCKILSQYGLNAIVR